MSAKKTKRPRRKRWFVTCEATVRLIREFEVLACTEEEAIRMCRERGGDNKGKIDNPSTFEIETECETDWKAEPRSGT